MGAFTQRGLRVLDRRSKHLERTIGAAARRFERSGHTDDDARLDMRKPRLDLERLGEWRLLLENRLQRS